ncbi:hypothetical protein BGZ65_003731, partial [Modicella reniformis]
MDPETAMRHWVRLSKNSPKEFMKTIRNDILTSSTIHDPPFGKRKSTYVDWLSSSKPLRNIEKIVADNVLPLYASTLQSHTTSTGRATAAAVHNSRSMISKCLNAETAKGHQHEAIVMFCGDGTMSAVLKVRDAYHLADESFWMRRVTEQNRARAACDQGPFAVSPSNTTIWPEYRPVVFISTQESESNISPWRASVADLVLIPETADHVLDLRQLEQQLVRYCQRPLKIGSFAAGSSLTGIMNDTVAISELLHRYDAFAFFDYSGVGAYTAIDMNPRPSSSYTMMRDSLAYKDGVFLSPHRMIGGPGSSGILAVRMDILSWAERFCSTGMTLSVRARPGSIGITGQVRPHSHKHTNSVTAHEEGIECSNILATIRTGLVFRLHQIMNPREILVKENLRAKEVLRRLSEPRNSNITVLGASDQDRVAVFCVTVSVPQLLAKKSGLQIHHALLCMIMNDFFGIEMGAECMDTGPHALQLLGLNVAKEDTSQNLTTDNVAEYDRDHYKTRDFLHVNWSRGAEGVSRKNSISPIMKPGFVRFSLPTYLMREKDVDFVLQSLEWVAQYGFLLIPFYRLDAESGTWTLRPLVRHAVCQSIRLKQLNRKHRSNYIQVATDCIYNLRKLFLQQQKMLINRTVPPSSTPSSTLPPPSIFYSLIQASTSLSNIFKTNPSSTRVDSSGAVQDTSPTSLHVPTSPAMAALYGNGNPSWYGSSLNLSMEESSDSESVTSSFAPRVHPVNTTPQFSGSNQVIKDALEELSLMRLEAELKVVETIALAKQLRWFLAPLEVAELYGATFLKRSTRVKTKDLRPCAYQLPQEPNKQN